MDALCDTAARGALPCLLSTLQSDNVRVWRNATRIWMHLSEKGTKYVQEIAELPGLAQELSGRCLQSDDREIRLNAMRALSHLIERNDKFTSEIVSAAPLLAEVCLSGLWRH